MENFVKNIKFIYTPEAKKLLPEYLNITQSLLENDLKEDKYVFGDEIIEITASDIKEAIERNRAGKFRKFEKTSSRSNYYRLIVGIYATVGFFALTIGIFFDSLYRIIALQPQRAALIFVGSLTLVAAAYLSQVVKNRENLRYKKTEESYLKTRSHKDLEEELQIVMNQISELQNKQSH